MNVSVASILISVALSTGTALGAWPSWEQRKELWLRGEITDRAANKTWDVVVVPGAQAINRRFRDAWRDSAETLASMAHEPFWARRKAQLTSGLRFSRRAVRTQGLDGIAHDFDETRAENGKVAHGEMGSVFFPLVNWTWFGVRSTARTVWMPVGAAGGVAYGVGAPVISTVTQVVLKGAVYDALARGVAMPAALYAWNGIAWVALSAGNVPTRESAFVRLVPRNQVAVIPEQDVVVERAAFEAIVRHAVVKQVTNDRLAELSARIQQIEEEAHAKEQPLVEERYAVLQRFAKNPEPGAGAAIRIADDARAGRSIRLSPDASALYRNPPELSGLVERALEEAGIAQPSDQLVDHALRAVAADVGALHLDRVKSAEPSHAVIATVLSVPVRADEIEPSSEEVREIDRSLSPDASEADRAKRIASLRARRLEARIAGPLGKRSCAEHACEPTRQEIEAMRDIAVGRTAGAPDDETIRDWIWTWNFHRALHEKYGGQVIMQTTGPNAVEARRRWLEDEEANGEFRIGDSDLRAGFFEAVSAYRGNPIADPAEVFAHPPWASARDERR